MVPDSPINSDTERRIAARAADSGPADDAELADYRQRYGLSADPFSDDPAFPLFTGAQRRELLDQLLHLCQFGNSLLVILGERGTGKTRIAHALLDSLAETDESCLIAANADMSLTQLLATIAESLGLHCEGSESAGQLLAALRGFSQPVMGSADLALVVIDDAHCLEDRTLAALLSLLQGRDDDDRRLHLAFFADPSLIARLDQLDMQDVMINDFYIERFALNETVDYLNFRMEMADYLGPEVFTESLVEPWWREAQGALSAIHQRAREHLLESVLPPLNAARKPFPMIHIIAAAALVAVIIMMFLYGAGDDEKSTSQEGVISQSIPIKSLEPTRGVVDENAAQEQRSSFSIASSASVEVSATLPTSEAETTALYKESEPQSQMIPDEEMASAASSVSQSEVSLEEPSIATPEPKAAPIKKPEPQVVPTTPAPTPAKVTQFSEDERILLSWKSSEYTLQLLGVSSEKAARDYIAGQPNRADLLMFKSLRKGKDWFVVVSGRFASAGAAREAVSGLTAAQRKAGPWPRELSGIQQEINSY